MFRVESSGILGFGMRTSALGTQISLAIGIQNPSSTDKESGIQYLESGIHCMESRIQDSLTRGDMYMCKIRALVEATFQRFFSPSYTIRACKQALCFIESKLSDYTHLQAAF